MKIQTKKCIVCNRTFTKPVTCSQSYWKIRKYCSNDCANKDKKSPWLDKYKFIKGHEPNETAFKSGSEPWNKDKKGYMSEEGKKNIRDALKITKSKETKEQCRLRIQKIVERRTLNKSYGTPQKIGSENPRWKDNQALYNAKHRWLQNHKEKTGYCQICGDKPIPTGRKKIGTEWANIGHNYDRNNPKEWIELCPTCHRKLDKNLLKI